MEKRSNNLKPLSQIRNFRISSQVWYQYFTLRPVQQSISKVQMTVKGAFSSALKTYEEGMDKDSHIYTRLIPIPCYPFLNLNN